MMLNLAMDLLVAGLLVATIVYCFLLNRRLDGLRAGQAELRVLIAEFNKATDNARAGVAALKLAGEEAGRTLQEQTAKARALADELSFMNETGGRLADRLAGGIETARRQAPKAVPAEAEPPRSEAERELMQALRRVK
jgi:hypothetical protein